MRISQPIMTSISSTQVDIYSSDERQIFLHFWPCCAWKRGIGHSWLPAVHSTVDKMCHATSPLPKLSSCTCRGQKTPQPLNSFWQSCQLKGVTCPQRLNMFCFLSLFLGGQKPPFLCFGFGLQFFFYLDTDMSKVFFVIWKVRFSVVSEVLRIKTKSILQHSLIYAAVMNVVLFRN